MQVVKEQLKEGCTLPRFHTIQLRLGTTDETQVAPALQEVSSTLGSSVSVGSYPVRSKHHPRHILMYSVVELSM